MSDPHRLSITVTLPSGREYRWSPDERDSENVPTGLQFGSTIPGGFSTCTFTLPRNIIKDYPDEQLFSDVRITLPGGVVVWEGRVASLPREQGQSRTLTVGAVGHAAALKDKPFREIYRDSSLGRWQGMSLTRRATQAPTYGIFDGQSIGDSGTPAMQTAMTAPWTTQAVSEAWYDSGGIPLGAIAYFWQRDSTILDHTDTNWEWTVRLTDDLDTLSGDTTGNLRAAGASYGYLPATAARAAAVVYLYNAHSVSGDRTYGIDWTNLIVYGNHGLSRRGAEPNAGFYLSDLVADILPRVAPTLQLGDIEQTSFIITQAAYTDMTDGESVLFDLNKFEQKRMAVWTDRKFDMWTASPSTRTVWEARLSEGATLQLEGDSGDTVINGVVVQYTDPYGKPRVMGPTGFSPADQTFDDLLISDTSNAATAAGLQKYAPLPLTFPTDSDGAKQVGIAYLAEQQLPQRKGSISLTGLVKHPTEGMVPASRVRAGDFIRVADRPGDGPREITQTGYVHDSHAVVCAVGGLPLTLEAIMERIAAGGQNIT